MAERDAKKIKIDWQFSIEHARTKFSRHYEQVHAGNQLGKNT